MTNAQKVRCRNNSISVSFHLTEIKREARDISKVQLREVSIRLLRQQMMKIIKMDLVKIIKLMGNKLMTIKLVRYAREEVRNGGKSKYLLF